MLEIMNSFIYNSKEDLKKELHNRIKNRNTQEVKNILDYAVENKIILDLNEKDINIWYPLLDAIFINNIKMVQFLIDYANKNNIILILNRKNGNGWNPLLRATSYNNIEIVKLLIDYANKNKIIFE